MKPISREAYPHERGQQILGIVFFDGSAREAVEEMSRRGGYLVVPAAPALVKISSDPTYRAALVAADMAIADSGYMVLLWQLLRRGRINRVSGLKYLQLLFEQPDLRAASSMFFVVPTSAARDRTAAWLRTRGFDVAADHLYIAPIYQSGVFDDELVRALDQLRPPHVIIGLGGGTQEPLGLYLREHLSYRPAIYCIGAALGFITGDQQPIPDWADRLYLGWLLRLLREPRRYFGRYWAARRLPGLIWKYGRDLPPVSRQD